MTQRWTFVLMIAVFLGLAAPEVWAEERPEFGPCIGQATHVALVHVRDDMDDTFVVVESWCGDLEPGEVIAVPELGRMSARRMVLCLKQPKRGPHMKAKWSGAGYDLRTSVAWILGDKVFAVQQPRNPGAAYIAELHWAPTLEKLKGCVLSRFQDRHEFQAAMATRSTQSKIGALEKIANGNSAYRDEAIKALGTCGPAAVDVLRRIVEGPPDHRQKYAITAMAVAGGRPALDALDAMLDDEMAYWKKTAPKLRRGWWTPGDTENAEAWVRYGNLMTLLRALNKHGHPAAREKIRAARAFFSAQPVLEEDRRITKMTDYCEYLLTANEQEEKQE